MVRAILVFYEKTWKNEVDFSPQNMKWYQVVNFPTKVVVLCYNSLFVICNSSSCPRNLDVGDVNNKVGIMFVAVVFQMA
jgi:hypothetical protein